MKHLDFINQSSARLQLLKRLRRYYRNQTSHSVTLKKWNKHQVSKLEDFWPDTRNTIVNIVVTLENKFDMDRDLAIYTAIRFYRKRRTEMRLYMVDWFEMGKRTQRIKPMSKRKGLKEQIARGFIPIEDFEIDPSLPYIRSNIKPLVYPKQWPLEKGSNMGGIYDRFSSIGVRGFTGITLPKRFRN